MFRFSLGRDLEQWLARGGFVPSDVQAQGREPLCGEASLWSVVLGESRRPASADFFSEYARDDRSIKKFPGLVPKAHHRKAPLVFFQDQLLWKACPLRRDTFRYGGRP